jgi:hypothetical protein
VDTTLLVVATALPSIDFSGEGDTIGYGVVIFIGLLSMWWKLTRGKGSG